LTTPLPRRAYLGAELPGDSEAFTPDGIRIAGVAGGSMAALAGLRAGDVLVSIGGHQLHDLRTLFAALRNAGHAASVELIVLRDGVHQVVHADVVAVPPEPDARYGVLDVDGARLRTILTCAEMPRALIAVIQGIACESVDFALDPDAPLATLIAGWTRAGYDTMRFDKRGVGDSEGAACAEIDFRTELADARAAIEHARATARQRNVPLVCFGHSVGGIIASQLAREFDAIIVYGTPVMRWLDCLLDAVE
jgi:uncharacterized protein